MRPIAVIAGSGLQALGTLLGLLTSGVAAALGLIGLIDQIFGFEQLKTLSGSIHAIALRLVGWWELISIELVDWLGSSIGLQVEKNTIAAAVAMLLFSVVGTKYFQLGLSDVLNKPEPKRRGRPHKDPVKRETKRFLHFLKQKLNSILDYLKTEIWVPIAMIVSYLMIVFAINLQSTGVHPETLKGIAYAVLAYTGWQAIQSLMKRQSYIYYLVAMGVATLLLSGLSAYIQWQNPVI